MTSEKIATVGKHEPVLSVQGLTTSFLVDGVWKPVVDDVSFDVHPEKPWQSSGNPARARA